MVLKLVTWGDIQVGDTVIVSSIHSLPQRVLQITEQTAPMGGPWREVVLEGDEVKITPNGTRCPFNSSPVLLVGRPWPEERTDLLMRLRVGDLVQNLAAKCANIMKPPTPDEIASLQAAIEEYELGKPEQK